MSYALKDETETWPTNQPLSDFARRTCRPHANIAISDYFARLWPPFVKLKKRVNDIVVSAQSELHQLTSRLSEYRQLFETGDGFVRQDKTFCFIALEHPR